MKVYLYPKCSTCQNALKFLEQKQVTSQIINISIQPPTIVELEKMLHFQKGNIKKLLNTSGLVYREMKLSEKLPSMSQEEILKLLSENGMLVKRPFLLTSEVGLVGFKESEWSLVL